jgi:hypothetical protein
MNTNRLFLTLTTGLMIFLSPLGPKTALAQSAAQTAIGNAAAEYGLGRPKPESPQAMETPKPRNEGWWQAFERGSVYWHPRYGARVVKGKILEAWAGQRWEQGPMGFPNASEIECPDPDAHDRYQSFEGGKIYWNSRTNEATVFKNTERFAESGKCFAPAQSRFRITINGFTCNRPTADQLSSLADGPDDEVRVSSRNFVVEKRPGESATVFNRGESVTPVIGDTSIGRSFDRIRGGSGQMLGANGGFRAGDSFPDSPQKHSTLSNGSVFPLLLWEGVLTRRQNAAVFIPTIWDYDGTENGLFADWFNFNPGNLVLVDGLIENSNSANQDVVKNSISAEYIQQIHLFLARNQFADHTAGYFPADHPIGMREYDSGDFRFRPQIFILTYDEALRMVRLSQSKNGEAFPFTFTDADSLGGGQYTLYLQVEQLPN